MNPFPPTSVFVLLAAAATPAAGQLDTMADGLNGFSTSAPLITIGETLSGTTGALNANTAGDYTMPGILDGLGATELDADTVRVFANHELLNFRGYPYAVNDGLGGTFTLTGARVSYIDIDKTSRTIVDAGVAYDTIYDGNGEVASDISFLLEGFGGFSRFCSSQLTDAGEFGLVDTLYFTGEEDGGAFNPVGGAMWVLDTATGEFWQAPELGRGAWENTTFIDSGSDDTIALLLADDSSPFDFDADGERENAPLYLYVGQKLDGPDANVLERNGFAQGQLYVFVADGGELTPTQFNGAGTLNGSWVAVDNSRDLGQASEDGSTGRDEYGYPTQGNLWTQAEALGAFGFSRPEDLATNPLDGTVAALASTGVDTFEIDPVSGNGVDTFGTIYTIRSNVQELTARLSILYDGDADPTRALRSPDNLDWAVDGAIYVQEDEAEEDTASGDEVLFGAGAANPNEAGIVRLDATTGATLRIMNINRDVVLDGSLGDPALAVDVDAGFAGEWESSGILDVSELFGAEPATLFLVDIQAHGIEDQDDFNPASRINDGDLVEGGQLLFLEAEQGSAFADLGNALAGANGEPVLTGTGLTTTNGPVSLELTGALAGAPATFVIGLSELSAPFKGGVFVPKDDVLVSGLVTDAAGAIAFDALWPALPSGTSLFFQYWIVDAAGPQGFAASNALSGTTP